MKYDFLIVGAGLAGAVIGQILAEAGKKVVAVDSRDHIGGNCYDKINDAGVLIHVYGPHLFHTNHDGVLNYLSGFTEWRDFELVASAFTGGEHFPMPINRLTLNKFYKMNLEGEEEVKNFIDGLKINIQNPQNARDQVLSAIGTEIYEAFFKNYTKKQWQMEPEELDASITARIPIRHNDDCRYFTDKYQKMPFNGYTAMIEKMFSGCKVILNLPFKEAKEQVSFEKLVYTGPIDEYFDCCLGALNYRGLRFEFETHDKEFYQDYAMVNYPNDHEYTRITEMKHATGQNINKTTIAKEYPASAEVGGKYYPVINPENLELCKKYEDLGKRQKNVRFAGRLGLYKYFNMDQTVMTSMDIAGEILAGVY